MRLLLALSGADREFLLREAPRDRLKYEGIGGAVLLTAAMAAVSSGIALRMALDLPVPLAVLAGLLWGTGILGLDRWLVAANQRQDSTFLTLLLALPRVALALVIGAVMSTPLVLQVFSPEIEARISQQQQADKDRLERDLDADARFRDLTTERAALEQAERELAAGPGDEEVFDDVAVHALRAELEQARQRLDEAELQLVCERDGTCGSARAGRGPAYEEKRERYERARDEVPRLEAALEAKEAEVRERLGREGSTTGTQLAERREDLTQRQEERDRAQAQREAAIEADDGLLARLEALDELSAERHAMELAHHALFALLTFLECLPVLIKLLMAFGKRTLYEELTTAADADAVRSKRLERDAAYQRRERDVADEVRAEEDRARAARLAGDAAYGLDLMQHAADAQVAEDQHRARVHGAREGLRIDLDLRQRQHRLRAELEEWVNLDEDEQQRLASGAPQAAAAGADAGAGA